MKRFHSFETGNVIGDGTHYDLMQWLEDLVRVFHPENGIEWFSSMQKDGEKVNVSSGDDGVKHVACFVRTGNCEGRIIEVVALHRDKHYVPLIAIKSFGPSSECWSIAATISDALESIYLHHEIPKIVEMHRAIPRKYRWQSETTLKGPLQIARTSNSLTLSNNGKTIWTYEVDQEPLVGKCFLDAMQTDWRILLGNHQIASVNVKSEEQVAEAA